MMTQRRTSILALLVAGMAFADEIPLDSFECRTVGQTFEVRAAADTDGIEGLSFRHQYFVAREKSPPGFVYDDATRVARLVDDGADLLLDNGPNDRDPKPGRVEIRLDTLSWRPGLYHFAVELVGSQGIRSSQRDVALKVPSPDDSLEVTVSPSWRLFDGTHAERVARLVDGTLVHAAHFSVDNGLTWTKRGTGTIGAGSQPLLDGTLLGMAYKTAPVEGRPGWYAGQRYVSKDAGKTVEGPIETLFHVPQAKAAMGHAMHKGPLYMRSIVEEPNGRLVALTAGWFVGDDKLCPYGRERPYSRTYVCDSVNGGETWAYVSTIGYDFIGSEGYNEGSMKALPNGDLMAVMRTGSMKDPKCQDNPIMVAMSADGGRTWTEPRRTGVNGAFPDLLVLSDGTLAVSYGRPGASIMFSTDGGRTWTDHTVVDVTPYSGYTTICETAPGEILMLFGVRDRLDPKTGQRENGIRAARVRHDANAKPASRQGSR